MKTSKVLNENELNVYINELNSPRLCWLDEDDLHDTIIELLQEISLLTGAEVYEQQFKNLALAKTIENLFRNNPKIMNLTITEVRNAFYLNHNGTYDKVHTMYGKPISADYIGNVIRDYLEYKLRPLDKQWAIDKLLNPPPEKPIPIYTDADYKKMIQDDYVRHQRGDTDMIFNIEKKYVLMRRLNIIIIPSRDAWAKWYNLALKKREWAVKQERPLNDAERLKKKNALDIYEAIRETHIIPKQEHFSTVLMLRKLVYFRFFELMADANIVDIFNEITCSQYDSNQGIIFVKSQATL